MRKAIFAVLIVALAVLAVTCDSVVLPATLSSGQEPGQVAPMEPEWTTINIGIGDSNGRARAMDKTLNESSVDFYEVVFSYNNGAITVRDTKTTTAGVLPSGWTLSVPAVDYTLAGANKAVLYAGKNDTKLLIATAAGAANLKTTNSVNFALSAITNPSPFTLSGSSTGTETDPDTITGGESVPVYRMVSGSTPLNAAYTFVLPANANAVVSAAGTVSLGTVSSPTPGNITPTIGSLSPSSGAIGPNAAFSFDITPGGTTGYCKISIAVPVNALGTAAGRGGVAATAWSLQGGLANTTLDTGTNTGGAILLQVTTGPTVTVDRSGTGAPTGWDGNNPETWTISISESLGENIVLEATPSLFTTPGSVTYAWKTNTTGVTTSSGTDAAATSIDGVTDATLAILTIPSTSSDFTSVSTFYVYCVASVASDSESAISNVIKIVVQDDPVDATATINVTFP